MISIIVPIYNVKGYLYQCVESVKNQTFKDWECILVDDGSTDGCAAVCDEYAAKDSRIKVIHKKNGGLSDARNAGMKVAQGEWTYFLDSDDWLHPEAMQKLYSFASENDCDIVQGGQYYAYSDHLLYRQPTRNEECQTVLTNDEAMRLLIINDRVKNFAWGKLYRTELIRDIEFPVGKYFEDSYWQHLVFSRVNKYGIVDTPLYYYRQRDNGISGEFSDRNLDLLKGYEDRLAFVKMHYPQYAKLMLKMFYKTMTSTCNLGVKNGMSCYKDYKEYADRIYDFSECQENIFDHVKSVYGRIVTRIFGGLYKKIYYDSRILQ